MLAQNFKTPAELHITDVEFDALFKVLGMLERDEIPYGELPGYPRAPIGVPEPTLFNLALVYAYTTDCGTAACLCGWARHVSKDAFLFVGSPDGKKQGLHDLFLMGSVSPETASAVDCGYEVKPTQAAIALRNYLTHGEPRWAEALSD